MRNIPSYDEFVNESLVFLTLEKTMKNEFMNQIQLKRDFEMARRLFYDNGGCLLTHMGSDEFELRTYADFTPEQLTEMIDGRINPSTVKMKFTRKGKAKKSELKEKVWTIKGKLI